jgi:hypothetical protein
MSFEVVRPRSEQPEVWIGVVGIAPGENPQIDDWPEDAVGAFVHVLSWAQTASEYLDAVGAAVEAMGFEVYTTSEVMPFDEWISEGIEEDEADLTEHYQELAQQVRATKGTVFNDTYYFFDEYQSEWEALADSITDIGYWNWWDEDFPHSIRVEFGGVQLWMPPSPDSETPRGTVALQFNNPTSVSFLIHQDAPADIPENWPDLLRNDEFERFNFRDDGAFVFNEHEYVLEILNSARHVDTRFGVSPRDEHFLRSQCIVAFGAGPVGCIIGAENMEIITSAGEISLDDVPELHERWWEYWREYWDVRGTPNALPEDYACEATVPAEVMPEDLEEEENDDRRN